MMATRREFLKQTAAAGLVAAPTWHIARAAQTDAPTRASSPTGRTPGIVQTVLGPLDASKLGFTLTHEHICRNPSEHFGGRTNSVAKAVDGLGPGVDFCLRSKRGAVAHLFLATDIGKEATDITFWQVTRKR